MHVTRPVISHLENASDEHDEDLDKKGQFYSVQDMKEEVCTERPMLGKKPGKPKQHKFYFCAQCSYRTDRIYDMKRHTTYVHSKVKKFSCEMCGQKFKEAPTLFRHVKRNSCLVTNLGSNT